MKWAVTADTQFDDQMRYAKILPSGLSSRLRDAIQCFEWVVEEAVARKCEGLIVLGDVFDSRTAIEISVLDQVLRAFSGAAAELEIMVLVGNHDSYLRTPKVNSAQVFLGIADVWDSPVVVGEFAFSPWVDDVEVLAAQVKMLAADSRPRYLLGHCLVQGAVPSHVGIPPALLLPERWERVLLGDVHEPIALADGKIQYVGAPMQWHQGDQGRERGFFVLDDADSSLEFVPNLMSPRFYTLTSVDQLPKFPIRDCDFVRIKTDDPDVHKAIVEEIGPTAATVESLLVQFEGAEEPRLEISTSDPQAEVLARYLKYHDVDDEALLELGCELLDEASHA